VDRWQMANENPIMQDDHFLDDLRSVAARAHYYPQHVRDCSCDVTNLEIFRGRVTPATVVRLLQHITDLESKITRLQSSVINLRGGL
jgi:hypothetical protein